ncbi:MAG: TIGR02270 family protein [Deltaproteobacteria bacterium]|nr:TIGR02270 family protein [Deltaproteobacteria bacterium]
MPVIPIVLEQHAEEAAFLWLLRDAAVHEPHYSLSDLAHLDDRIEAHIDGLRIAGDEGWELLKETLAWEEAGEVFAAAVLAFETGVEKRIQAVLEAGSDDYELSRGLVSALGWLPFNQTNGYVQDLAAAESSALRRIGLAAFAVHRQDPGQFLVNALSDSDSVLRARALRAVGELGRKDLLPILKDHIDEDDEHCRFFAAWSAAVLGDASTVPILRNIAEGEKRYAENACCMAVRLLHLSDAHVWVQELFKNPNLQRLAVTGYGVIGDPMAVAWLIQMMEVEELARVAGESFTMITGVDLAYEDLEGEWPEGFEAGPTESPEDEDVEMDPDEDLPWPEPELIAGWWDKNKGKFANGTRYLLGQPISYKHLQQVLRNGYQRQRAAAALELAMLHPGKPLFEVRAPGFRQKQILGLK